MSSTFSEYSTNCHSETSNSFRTILHLPTMSKAKKSKHNFRCELILCLSMLQEIICKIFEMFCDQQSKKVSHDWIEAAEKQAQKLREEYFVILNYVTELIHEPRQHLQKYNVGRSHRKIIVKIKINILISKKHIFEILYELCKLKKSLRHHQNDRKRENSIYEVSSISSQVLMKIQDVCAKLKTMPANMSAEEASRRIGDACQNINLDIQGTKDGCDPKEHKYSQTEGKIDIEIQTMEGRDSVRIQKFNGELLTQNADTDHRKLSLFNELTRMEALNNVQPQIMEEKYSMSVEKYDKRTLTEDADADSERLTSLHIQSQVEPLDGNQFHITEPDDLMINQDFKTKAKTQKASENPRKMNSLSEQSKLEKVKSQKIIQSDVPESSTLHSILRAHELESKTKLDKCLVQNFNSNRNNECTVLQKTQIFREKEDELLKKIYQLLEDYLKKTKGMDRHNIKDLIEPEMLKYNERLKNLCSTVNLTKFPPSNEFIKLRTRKDDTRMTKNEQSRTFLQRIGDDSTECSHKTCFTDDELKPITATDQNIVTNKLCLKNQSILSELEQNLKPIDSNEKSSPKKFDLQSLCQDEIPHGKQMNKNQKVTTVEKVIGSKYCSDEKDSLQIKKGYLSINDQKNFKGCTSCLQHKPNCNCRDEYKVSDKELLRELRRLEMMVYCLQNESYKHLKQIREKQFGTVKSNPKNMNPGTLKSRRTEREQVLIEDASQLKNGSCRIFQCNRLKVNGGDLNQSELLNADVSSSLYKEKQEFQKKYSLNHNSPPIHKKPLTQELLSPIHENNNGEEIDNVEAEYKYQNTNIGQNKENINPELVTSHKVNTQNLRPARIKSKSENDVERILHGIPFQTDSADFTHEITGQFPIYEHKILENIQANGADRREQMVQTALRNKWNQKSFRGKRIVVANAVKYLKQKRKMLRPRRSRVVFNHVTQSETRSGQRRTEVNLKDESQQPIRSNCNEHYAGGENLSKYSLDVLTDCATSSIINDSIMSEVFSLQLTPNYYDHPQRLRKSPFTVCKTQSKNDNDICIKRNSYFINLDRDYTSKKIWQNSFNQSNDAKYENKEYLNSNVTDQNLNLGFRIPEPIFLKNSHSFSLIPNPLNPISQLDELAAEKSKVNRISHAKLDNSEIIHENVNDSDTSRMKCAANNNSLMKMKQQNLNARRNYFDQYELNAILSFTDLINLSDRHGLFNKIDSGSGTQTFSSTSSENFITTFEREENIQENQRQNIRKPEKRISNSSLQNHQSTHLSEKSERTPMNTEYTKTKLDAKSWRDLITNLLFDNQKFVPSNEKNEALLRLQKTNTMLSASDNVSAPLTSFYFDCAMDATKKGNVKTNADLKNDRSELNNYANNENLRINQRATPVKNRLQSKNIPKNFQINQNSIINSFKQRKHEKHKRPRTQFKARKSTVSIKSLTKVKQFINLTPCPDETMTQVVYPKAQLTISFMESKKRVEEIYQDPSLHFIRYHDLRKTTGDVSKVTATDIACDEEIFRNENEFLKENNSRERLHDRIIDFKREIKNLPMRLYDYNGLPLTNNNGEPLKNAYGKILVTFDENGTPILDNHKNIIFDARCKPSTSHKFNPYTPSKHNPFKVQLTNEQGKPLVLYNEEGFPVTDENGYSLFDIDGNPLIRFDSCGRPISDCKGYPLHTPSQGDIKYPEQSTRKCKESKRKRFATPQRDFTSISASILPRQCTANFENDTHPSLEISSVRTIEDFLAEENWTGQELGSDQMDLLSLLLTNDCSISSNTTSESFTDAPRHGN
ncbi:unnamed protein product [Bemisia tabaci]|uniref:Uncharacterized protein n=2 Tax=Bemisia tabaci TaxID=7038 RepID=A0A9P0G2E2_BEMTA|nr:unnamed protein product [Bemisia tabaci]